jgi:hypothetical protein
MPVQQMCQLEKKTKEGHGRTYLEDGFTSGYTRWIFHGEAHHTRDTTTHMTFYDEYSMTLVGIVTTPLYL